jgi:Arc/MetJ-type ribon-helix-helix transcriptional regulator
MSPNGLKRTQRKPTVHVHVRLDKELVDWIDQRIEQMTYKDRSHAINFAVKFLRDNTYEVTEVIPIRKEDLENQ